MKTKTIKTLGILFFTFLSTSCLAQEQRDRKRPERPSVEKIMKDLDVNEDGKISLKEAKGPLKHDFKKIDTNKDGFISKEEIEKAPKPERRERPQRPRH